MFNAKQLLSDIIEQATTTCTYIMHTHYDMFISVYSAKLLTERICETLCEKLVQQNVNLLYIEKTK